MWYHFYHQFQIDWQILDNFELIIKQLMACIEREPAHNYKLRLKKFFNAEIKDKVLQQRMWKLYSHLNMRVYNVLIEQVTKYYSQMFDIKL